MIKTGVTFACGCRTCSSDAVQLLLVEDNATLSASLQRGLYEDGFEVHAATTGAVAVSRLRQKDVDVVVLDLGLPDMDGLDVLAAARSDGMEAPVLVLTARDAVEARVSALEQGADDYLIKPFVYAELLARLRALVRRAQAPRWSPVVFAGLAMHSEERAVSFGGRSVPLSPREHALLAFLLRHKEATVARAELLREVFGYDFDPGTNLVDVHIANLRRKLRDAPAQIETVRGVGYRLRVEDPGHG